MGISLIGRVEASHSSFKRVIETASDSRDLQTVFNQIDCHMKQQHLKTRRAQQKNRIAADPFTARNPRHAELVGPVSKWAIDQIKNYETDARNKRILDECPAMDCNCTIKIIYKLPCHHLFPTEGAIPVELIDKRWLIDRGKHRMQKVFQVQIMKICYATVEGITNTSKPSETGSLESDLLLIILFSREEFPYPEFA